ncbi:RDD family protein [Bdellovibrionota bacterium FG-2]
MDAETPLPVAETPKFAGFWVRSFAEGIDSTALSLASWLVELALLGGFYWLARVFGREQAAFMDSFNPLFLQVFNLGIYAILAVPYYVIGHERYGTTWGKRPFRVFVVDADSLGKITLKQSWIRCLAYGLSYLPFGAGFLMAAFHPEKRALHDLIAGTVSVVRTGVRVRASSQSVV